MLLLIDEFEGELLAHWTYTPDEWNRYLDDQWGQAFRGVIRSAAVFLALAAGVGLLSRQLIPFLVALVLMEWIPALEYHSARRSRQALGQEPQDSFVFEDVIRYRHFVLGERQARLGGRRVIRAGLRQGPTGQTYLEVVHKGRSRKSSILPESIPVPDGRAEEANRVADRLRALHAVNEKKG